MRTTPGATTKASAAVLPVLLVMLTAGCGSDTSDGGSDPATGSEEETATLTADPFCDQVDTALVGGVLDLPAEKVRTQVDREVGEEFEGPDEEAEPPTSVANLCVFGSSTSQFVVSVQPDATPDDVQESIDELAGLTGKESSEVCETSDASAFGDPAAVYTCTSRKPMERVRVVATGLVDGSKFYCSAMMNQGAGADFRDKTVEACTTTMERLSSGA